MSIINLSAYSNPQDGLNLVQDGDTVKLDPGTWVAPSPPVLINRNNVTFEGSGIGRSILIDNGMDYAQTSVDVFITTGVLNICPDINSRQNSNIRVQGISFVRTVAIPAVNDYPRRVRGHVFTWKNIDGMRIEECEFAGGYGEVCYMEGYSNLFKVNRCLFRDSYQSYAMLNTNSTGCRNISIIDNDFQRGQMGLCILGSGVSISTNRFEDVNRYPVYVGETNTSVPTLSNCIVDGTTIKGLGKGRSDGSPCVGISIVTKQGIDAAPIISNTTILDTRVSHGAQVTGIQSCADAIIDKVLMSGLQAEDANGNNTRAIALGNNTETSAYDVSISNAKVKTLAATGEIPWAYGIYCGKDSDVSSNQTSIARMNNNQISATTALYVRPTNAGVTPVCVELNHETLNGAIVGQGTWGNADINATGVLSNSPLTGGNRYQIGSTVSGGVNPITLAPNDPQPDVTGLSWAIINNTQATTITALRGMIPGQGVYLSFRGNNTYIYNNSVMRMKYPGPIGDASIRYFFYDGTYFLEK